MNRPIPTVSTPHAGHSYVSTARVAVALGVSVTTVKRWVDDGVLPAHRTAGGHRKLLQADVVRLVREGNLPQADLGKLSDAGRATNDVGVLAKQMTKACRNRDVRQVRDLILAARRGGLGIDVIADKLIAPALAAVGHEWVAGKIGVMHEHRLTQACVSAVYELESALNAGAEAGRPVAVGGAPEFDHYILPTLLAKVTLLEAGWDAVNLGPHTPVSAFRAALDEFEPRLVWLSVTHLVEAEKWLAEFNDLYEVAAARGVVVAVGGRALTDGVRQRLAYTSHGDNLGQLVALATSLRGRPRPGKRGRPAGS